MRLTHRFASAARRHGFSVIELLLAVAIMTVIIIGLYTVFDATQKALRGTISQVDVLEGVRAASDLVGRELEGASQFPIPRYTNLYIARSPIAESVELQGLNESGPGILQTVLQDVFFHTRLGDRYGAIGYWVGPLQTNATGPISVGRLYRFATNVTQVQIDRMSTFTGADDALQRNALLTTFQSVQRLALSSPVMDGVVHFRVIAFTPGGYPLFPVGAEMSAAGQTYLQLMGRDLDNLVAAGVLHPDSYLAAVQEVAPPVSVRCQFSDLSYPQAPIALEVELGVIEPQLVSRYTAIPVAAEARKFLARHAGQVHLFRQRIPLRNSPPF